MTADHDLTDDEPQDALLLVEVELVETVGEAVEEQPSDPELAAERGERIGRVTAARVQTRREGEMQDDDTCSRARSALVTGSRSRIGPATTRRLADDGAAAALLTRRRDQLDENASAIRSNGGSALVLKSDVTEQRQVVDAVE